MIDNKYIGKLDAQDKRWYDYLLHDKHKGNECGVLDDLLHSLDCTKVYDCGRPMQTINYGYRTDIAGYLYILDKLEYNKELHDKYLDKLYIRHEENLNFEKHTPPVHYSAKQRTSGRNNRRTAEIADIFTGEKSTVDVGSGRIIKPKENAAIRKAKALNERSVSFAFNNFKVNK